MLNLQKKVALLCGLRRNLFGKATQDDFCCRVKPFTKAMVFCSLAQQHYLAAKLIKGFNVIILVNETLKLNSAKMAALDQQAPAAKKKLELRRGPVDVMRDVEVKAAQAKSQQQGYETALNSSTMQCAAITGVQPRVLDFALEQKDRSPRLKLTKEYLDLVVQSSPALLATRFSERVANRAKKNTGALPPSISVTCNSSSAGRPLLATTPTQAYL